MTSGNLDPYALCDLADGLIAEPPSRSQITRPRPRFALIPFGAITVGSQPVYLVKGLIPKVGVTAIWGAPKSGKTFATQDLAMHVALGWPYRGRRVKQGPVVYFAAEGATGFRARVEAYRRERLQPGDEPPFYLIDASILLTRDHRALVASIEAELGSEPPAAVVIDTLNRTFEGSESSDEAMTAYVNAAHAIKAALLCAVIVVHHSGLDESRMRGHTSLLGALDASLSIKRDGDDNILLTVVAMKDGPTGDEIASRLRTVNVGIDDDGDVITSCVVEPVLDDVRPTILPKRRSLGKAAKAALAAFHQAIGDVGAIPPASPDIPAGISCITVDQWRIYAYDRGISGSDAPRARQQAFKRAAEELIAEGRLTIGDKYAWERAA